MRIGKRKKESAVARGVRNLYVSSGAKTAVDATGKYFFKPVGEAIDSATSVGATYVVNPLLEGLENGYKEFAGAIEATGKSVWMAGGEDATGAVVGGYKLAGKAALKAGVVMPLYVLEGAVSLAVGAVATPTMFGLEKFMESDTRREEMKKERMIAEAAPVLEYSEEMDDPEVFHDWLREKEYEKASGEFLRKLRHERYREWGVTDSSGYRILDDAREAISSFRGAAENKRSLKGLIKGVLSYRKLKKLRREIWDEDPDGGKMRKYFGRESPAEIYGRLKGFVEITGSSFREHEVEKILAMAFQRGDYGLIKRVEADLNAQVDSDAILQLLKREIDKPNLPQFQKPDTLEGELCRRLGLWTKRDQQLFDYRKSRGRRSPVYQAKVSALETLRKKIKNAKKASDLKPLSDFVYWQVYNDLERSGIKHRMAVPNEYVEEIGIKEVGRNLSNTVKSMVTGVLKGEFDRSVLEDFWSADGLIRYAIRQTGNSKLVPRNMKGLYGLAGAYARNLLEQTENRTAKRAARKMTYKALKALKGKGGFLSDREVALAWMGEPVEDEACAFLEKLVKEKDFEGVSRLKRRAIKSGMLKAVSAYNKLTGSQSKEDLYQTLRNRLKIKRGEVKFDDIDFYVDALSELGLLDEKGQEFFGILPEMADGEPEKQQPDHMLITIPERKSVQEKGKKLEASVLSSYLKAVMKSETIDGYRPPAEESWWTTYDMMKKNGIEHEMRLQPGTLGRLLDRSLSGIQHFSGQMTADFGNKVRNTRTFDGFWYHWDMFDYTSGEIASDCKDGGVLKELRGTKKSAAEAHFSAARYGADMATANLVTLNNARNNGGLDAEDAIRLLRDAEALKRMVNKSASLVKKNVDDFDVRREISRVRDNLASNLDKMKGAFKVKV